MHNYNVMGYPKEKIIFYISILSVTLVTLIERFLGFIQEIIGFTLSVSLSVGIIFTIIYTVFSKYLWRTKPFSKIYNYPNLNGQYSVEGKSVKKITDENFEWKGELSIKQDWDKIHITLRTINSSSDSISVAGAIEYLPMRGYCLKYLYQNTPNNNQPELHRHVGFCELTFNEKVECANGNYFNDGKDRQTYGSMILRRI